MEEFWKDVVGYEGRYEVSNLGRIRSIDRKTTRKFNFGTTGIIGYPSKILKPMSTKFDYLKYGLSKNGKTTSFVGHRLVAMAWIPNPNNYPQVHHKDHNKHNNAVENLEWVTPSQNTKYAISAGRHHGGFKMGTTHHSGKFTDDQIKWMRNLHKDGYSLTQLSEIFNSNRGYLSSVINNKRRIISNAENVVFCNAIPFSAITLS
jgi:hypothetical protein